MNKRPTTTIICVLLTLATVFASAFALVACNKTPDWKLTDIYRHNQSPQEFTSYKQEMTLPSGWSVYTTSKTTSSTTQTDNVNSDVGYIKSLNAFVISSKDSANETCLSLVKCDDERVYFEGGIKGMMFPQSMGISSLRVKDGLIAVKFKNGEACVYDTNAKIVLSRTKTHNVSVTIDKAIKILDSGLIAVGYAYDVNGASGFTSIYRPTTSGEVSKRGQLVCRVQNQDNDLSYVNGFDGKYVSVVGNDEGSYMFAIPQNASQTVQNLKAEENKGLVKDNGNDDYYSELTYIGNGKFFVHEDWTVDKEEEYTYFDGENYFEVSRHVYTPDNQKYSEYTANANKMFLSLANNYYDSTKANIDTRELLNDGFIYASYGIDVNEEEGVKVGHYDQFILDSDLNVVLSLSGNYGVNIKMQEKEEEVGVFDLIKNYTDDVMYVPYLPSNVSYYDADGALLGTNNKYTVVAQNYANGIAVAQASFTSGSSVTSAYGAFNQKGEVVIPFNYSALTSFRGFYAVGERKVDDKNKVFLIGKDGNEVEYMSDMSTPLADIAKSASGYMYKIGCYMFEQVIDGTSYFGMKNFNANVEKNLIMPARLTAGCILYAPPSSTVDVFVFEKITASDKSVSYTIYRMI